MVTISPIIHLQQDLFSLIDYMNGKSQIDCDIIKRRLINCRRSLSVYIPDHYYEYTGKQLLDSIKYTSDLFIKGCIELSNNFLDMDENNIIYVKEEKFCQWQDIITCISPLILISSKIFDKKFKKKICSQSDIRTFFSTYIVPNCRYTSLVAPCPIPFVKEFQKEKGFIDLHSHINGILESENVWQILLQNPEKNLNIFYKEDGGKLVIQKKLEQIGLPADTNLRCLIYEAIRLRSDFFSAVFCPGKNELFGNNKTGSGCIHPFSFILTGETNITIPNTILRFECLMYVLIFNYIKNNGKSVIVHKFHKYILIKGLFHHLLTQTITEFGFSQFQNITITKIRDFGEKSQLGKFLQIAGNDLNYTSFTEFRFSPKESVDENKKMLKKIGSDWQHFLEIKRKNIKEDYNVDYCLTAHFIKEKMKSNDNKPYESLRVEIRKKTNALVTIKKGGDDIAKRVVAVDAAASEFDTPPEIFAPSFRMLRKEGFKHFTYHAGEDFFHVLSGLRAIYEAVEFCELRKGDRIGHASAAGVDIEQWKEIIGESFFLPAGEWADNLLFVYHFIVKARINELETKLPILSDKIIKLYAEIFDKSYLMPDIVLAWEVLRKEDNIKDNTLSHDANEINEKYQSMKFRKKYIAPLEINSDEVFTNNELVLLQKKLLEYLHKKEIIIEVLPTSNLRIGYHFTLQTYQLFTWYQWKKEGLPIPPIVLGTDDPGIFATNIYNEYAFVYCFLVYEKKQTRSDVIQFIRFLCENGLNYEFLPA